MTDKPEMVDSASDKRIVNNAMRHGYRVLNDTEKQQMQDLKDMGLAMYNLLHAIGGTDPSQDRFATRELSIAATKVEEAVMWGVKSVTR